MKWAALLLLLIMVPAVSSWLRGKPDRLLKLSFCWGFLALQHGPLDLYIAPVSWASWPGYVKGFEVSVIDALSLAILLSLPRVEGRFPAIRWMMVYAAVAAISSFTAEEAQPALFYAWQIVRIAFFAYVLCRAVTTDISIAANFLVGMGAGLLLVVALAVVDRAQGGFQTGGSFAHQNTLGLAAHFIVLPFFALLLGGIKMRGVVLIPIAGILITLLTVSRGTLLVMACGFAVLFLLSAWSKWTPLKGKVLTAALLTTAVISPLVISTFNQRLSEGRTMLEEGEEYDERLAFERASSMMLNDHLLGVGANNYVLAANSQGYSSRAGVAPTYGSRSAHVHNVYWLVAAETGYPGLLAFLVMLFVPLRSAVRLWRAARETFQGHLALGLAVALGMAYVHSLYEWLLVSLEIQYLLAGAFGLIGGIAGHQASGGRSNAELARSPSSAT